MNKKYQWMFAFLSVWMLLPSAVFAQTTVNIEADMDTTLFETGLLNSAEVDGSELANGSGQYLFAGLTKSYGLRRALLHFDIANAGIPTDATITEVKFWITPNRYGGAGTSELMQIYRMNKPWSEGASDAEANEGQGQFAEVGEPTWSYQAYSTAEWDTVGGDYFPEIRVNTAFWPIRIDIENEFNLTSLIPDVEDWLHNPDQNFGWILLIDEATPLSAFRFHSREATNPAHRPQLFVTYESATPSINRGDLNCDTVTNLIDVILIKRLDAFLVQSAEDCDSVDETHVFSPACDVNGDGSCGLVDAVSIQQCNAFLENPYCSLLP